MKSAVFTPNAPAPIGPYSQAIQLGDLLFVSGQVALDPESGKMNNQTLEVETTQVLKNLNAVLSAAQMDFSNIVKTTIFLMDMKDFAEVNSLYKAAFPENAVFPARETVQVSGLPAGARIEISVIASR